MRNRIEFKEWHGPQLASLQNNAGPEGFFPHANGDFIIDRNQEIVLDETFKIFARCSVVGEGAQVHESCAQGFIVSKNFDGIWALRRYPYGNGEKPEEKHPKANDPSGQTFRNFIVRGNRKCNLFRGGGAQCTTYEKLWLQNAVADGRCFYTPESSHSLLMQQCAFYGDTRNQRRAATGHRAYGAQVQENTNKYMQCNYGTVLVNCRDSTLMGNDYEHCTLPLGITQGSENIFGRGLKFHHFGETPLDFTGAKDFDIKIRFRNADRKGAHYMRDLNGKKVQVFKFRRKKDSIVIYFWTSTNADGRKVVNRATS